MTTKNYSLILDRTFNGKLLKTVVATRPNINLKGAISSFNSTYGFNFDKQGHFNSPQGAYRIVDVIPAGYQPARKL